MLAGLSLGLDVALGSVVFRAVPSAEISHKMRAWLNCLHLRRMAFNDAHVLLISKILEHLKVGLILIHGGLLSIQDHVDLFHFVVRNHL